MEERTDEGKSDVQSAVSALHVGLTDKPNSKAKENTYMSAYVIDKYWSLKTIFQCEISPDSGGFQTK